MRMHALDPLLDLVGIGAPGRARRVRDAMRAIAAEGRGVVVLLRDLHMRLAAGDRRLAADAAPVRPRRADPVVARACRASSSSPTRPSPRVVGLEAYGLEIAGTRPITGRLSHGRTGRARPAPPALRGRPAQVLIVVAPYYRDIADALLAGRAGRDRGLGRHARDGRGARRARDRRPPSRIAARLGRLRRLRRARLRDPRRDLALRHRLRRERARPDAARARRAICIGNGILTVENARRRPRSAPTPTGQDKGGGAAAAALHLSRSSRRLRQRPEQGLGFLRDAAPERATAMKPDRDAGRQQQRRAASTRCRRCSRWRRPAPAVDRVRARVRDPPLRRRDRRRRAGRGRRRHLPPHHRPRRSPTRRGSTR